MSVYYIGMYDIDDPEQFQGYPPRSWRCFPSTGPGARLGYIALCHRGKGAKDERDHPVSLTGGGARIYNDPDYQEAKQMLPNPRATLPWCSWRSLRRLHRAIS